MPRRLGLLPPVRCRARGSPGRRPLASRVPGSGQAVGRRRPRRKPRHTDRGPAVLGLVALHGAHARDTQGGDADSADDVPTSRLGYSIHGDPHEKHRFDFCWKRLSLIWSRLLCAPGAFQYRCCLGSATAMRMMMPRIAAPQASTSPANARSAPCSGLSSCIWRPPAPRCASSGFGPVAERDRRDGESAAEEKKRGTY